MHFSWARCFFFFSINHHMLVKKKYEKKGLIKDNELR